MQKILFTLASIALLVGAYTVITHQTEAEKFELQSGNLTGQKVSDAATSLAGRHSTGYCARYVRRAIQKASGESDHPVGIVSAKDFGPFLKDHGYHATHKSYDQASTGDVAILQAHPGHPHGHIAIKCADGHWRSDFVQHSFWIYRDGAHPAYTVYSL